MKKLRLIIVLGAGTLLLTLPLFSENPILEGQGQAVVTVLPKQGVETPARVSQRDLQLAVDGKQTDITRWTSLQGPDNHLEMVLLIDSSGRASLGNQMGDIAHFLQTLPANAKAAIAYMRNGRAVFSAPLSTDHAQVARELHMPGGSPGSNASPYFCLSDLAQHWPSPDLTARREVVMITDGIDNYSPGFFDSQQDPYVEAAINDAVRARLVVYAIAWKSQGFAGQSLYQASAGQNLLLEVAQATGGKNYWEGLSNPVSLQPFLEDLTRRLKNQYELGFVARLVGKPEVESLKLKTNAPETIIDSPREVFVGRAALIQY
jgi:hypothetical protein